MDEWNERLRASLDELPGCHRAVALAFTLEAVAPIGRAYADATNVELGDALRAGLDELWDQLDRGAAPASAPRETPAFERALREELASRRSDGIGARASAPRDRGGEAPTEEMSRTHALRDATRPLWQALLRVRGSDERSSSEHIAASCDEIVYAIGYAYLAVWDRPSRVTSEVFERCGELPVQAALRRFSSEAVEQVVMTRFAARSALFRKLRRVAREAAGTFVRELPQHRSGTRRAGPRARLVESDEPGGRPGSEAQGRPARSGG